MRDRGDAEAPSAGTSQTTNHKAPEPKQRLRRVGTNHRPPTRSLSRPSSRSRLPRIPTPSQQSSHRQSSRPKSDSIRPKLTQLDRSLPISMMQGMRSSRLPNIRQQLGPQSEPRPPPNHDLLRIEEIDQVSDPSTEIPRRILQHLGRS